MGYHDDDDAPLAARADAPSIVELVLGATVRALGLVVLFVGLWVGVKIVLEAWTLYQEPARIERFAVEIQRGSNIDGVLAGLGAGDADAQQAADGARASGPASGLRLSYFAAWLIALLLMFVVGSLAMAAITTGGQLVLYDLQVRRHSRAVVREVRKLRRAA